MHIILGFTVFITARFLVFIWNNDALVLGIFNTCFACVNMVQMALCFSGRSVLAVGPKAQ